MNKLPLPPLRTDEEAERFVAEADLSDYDLSGARLMQFHQTTPEGYDRVRALIPDAVLTRAVQLAGAAQKPLDRFLGEIIERALEPSA